MFRRAPSRIATMAWKPRVFVVSSTICISPPAAIVSPLSRIVVDPLGPRVGPDRYEHAGNEPYYTEATKRNSSEFNRIEEEARFSSRCAIEDVPGIGNTAGERCSSQASEIWLGVALWR